jgi:hypothetical protein
MQKQPSLVPVTSRRVITLLAIIPALGGAMARRSKTMMLSTGRMLLFAPARTPWTAGQDKFPRLQETANPVARELMCLF